MMPPANSAPVAESQKHFSICPSTSVVTAFRSESGRGRASGAANQMNDESPSATAPKIARRMAFLPLSGRCFLLNDVRMPAPRNAESTSPFVLYDLRAAFTLLELLAVTAILAILAALALSVVRMSIAAGDRTACLHNLKTLHAGVMLFAAENNGQIVAANSGSDNSLPQFRVHLQPYLSNGEGPAKEEKYFFCRAALRARNVNFSEPTITYGYNGSLSYPTAQPPRLMRLNEISQPGKTMMIMDGRFARPTIWNLVVGPGANRRPQPADFVHDGRVNAIYVDGHASTLNPEELPADSKDVFWNAKDSVP